MIIYCSHNTEEEALNHVKKMRKANPKHKYGTCFDEQKGWRSYFKYEGLLSNQEKQNAEI